MGSDDSAVIFEKLQGFNLLRRKVNGKKFYVKDNVYGDAAMAVGSKAEKFTISSAYANEITDVTLKRLFLDETWIKKMNARRKKYLEEQIVIKKEAKAEKKRKRDEASADSEPPKKARQLDANAQPASDKKKEEK